MRSRARRTSSARSGRRCSSTTSPREPRRFSELEKACPGISPRTLSERLRWLEEEGVVARHSYAETPPRVEYELTPKGLGLLPVIEAMRQFGHDWLVHDPDHVHA